MENHFDLSLAQADYFAHPAASKHALTMALHWYPGKAYKDPVSGRAGDIGTAVHQLFLEDKCDWEVAPEYDARTKVGKAIRDAFLEKAKDAPFILSRDENEQAIGMYLSLKAKVPANIMKSAQTEVSGFWHDTEYDLDFKIRPDIISHDKKLIFDVKTTEDLSTLLIRKTCYRYHYYLQSWLYRRGVKAITGEDYAFVFIFVSKWVPYPVRFFTLTEEWDRSAVNLFERCLTAWKTKQENQDREIPLTVEALDA